MSRTLIVIPTYNEATNLEPLVSSLRAHAADADILVVDDASPDGTGEIADRLAVDPAVHVLHRPAKAGLGVAYRPKPALAEIADARLDHHGLDALLWAADIHRRHWVEA